jgi:hypothetical protein
MSPADADEGGEADPQSETSPHPFFAGSCGGGGGVSGISSIGSGGSVSPRIDELPSADEGSPIAFSEMTVMHTKSVSLLDPVQLAQLDTRATGPR